ncbi:MAG: nucleotide sugar dehydrogenase [Verrucomicrobia bacterium]|mgnify:FL=1|jgi:nucleotide sugar dehydrogenase|nr:nucleotide sugar dehydrogenase [Verrucomicrobiota bacterium]OQC70758.1 MAG: UDP-N-acetyl-D-glucosamine 6-dehydrogenase [candidate division Hyd24-12 bacterium ADurb.Bin004]MDI9382361.1 nucleotide sugar dehydrogenase [Verrucomicrobiota bacterium]NMD22243.1 nucleotide sugar dehydrogenase [Verrucomicrobiota bacterium]HNV00436.1 nucleotide sugar dehydrogenase [Verrucomicrobiota bacterium]
MKEAKSVSISPTGEKFPLPSPKDYKKEFARLEALAKARRKQGQEVVVVVGLGFVGAVMAAVVADARDKKSGRPNKLVIGMQRPSPRSYWKIPLLNRGISPVKAEDPEVETLIGRCVKESKTLVATYTEEALRLADVVVVDVQCDYLKESLGDVRTGSADMEALEASIGTIAERIPAGALVLIETTVAPGTTEQVAYPIMKKIFERRRIASEPLLAHSYERVMPGRNYVASIRDFWRVCSGINDEARDKVVRFLKDVLNTEKFPLTVLDRPIESETAKIVENSYRATILAFLDEWSMFAERNGVDLKKVIEAIRVRPTHSNLIFPGPGIGGYCLPKDGGLGMWAYKHIFGWEDNIFKITPAAININDTRSLHAPQLVRDALRNMGKPLAAAEVLILGAAYREDVGDTRYSGSEVMVRKLAEMGADVKVHDPYVEHWWEFEAQDTYPHPGYSLKRFFHRQDQLVNLRIQPDLKAALSGVDAVVFAVRHQQYLKLDPDAVFRQVGKPFAVVDCFCILSDAQIRRYLELGCDVKGMGRGHIKRIKDSISASKRP